MRACGLILRLSLYLKYYTQHHAQPAYFGHRGRAAGAGLTGEAERGERQERGPPATTACPPKQTVLYAVS